MYVFFISKLLDLGEKLYLEISLGIVMRAVLCGAPKQSQGRGSHSLMVPSSVLEFTPCKANVLPVLTESQALNLDAPIGFSPLLI